MSEFAPAAESDTPAPSHPNQDQSALAKGIRAARRGNHPAALRWLTAALQAEPGNEEAWLWLARVQDDPQQRRASLQRALQINPNNQWAAQQLAESVPSAAGSVAHPQRQASEAHGVSEISPTATTAEQPLTVLNCPHCGAALQVRSEASKTITCRHCRTIVALGEQVAQANGSLGRWVKPAQPIEPGMKGRFANQLHEVIGWIQYEGRDDEDVWRWDEWLLLSERGELGWLSYDPEEGFVLQQKVLPTAPFDFHTCQSIPTSEGNIRVKERAAAKVCALGGELTWRVTLGDKIHYLEAEHRNRHYSVELVPDQELEIFRGNPLSAEFVWSAFQRADMLEQLTTQKLTANFFGNMRLICFLLAVGSLLAWLLFGGERTLHTQQFTLIPGEANGQESTAITITNASRPIRVALKSAALPTDSWAIVDVTLIEENDAEYFLFAQEFWDETGYDDGYWHESSLVGGQRFKLAQPGSYTLEVALDETSPGFAPASWPIELTVYDRVWVAEYWLGAAVLFLLFVFYCHVRAQNQAVGVFMQNMLSEDE